MKSTSIPFLVALLLLASWPGRAAGLIALPRTGQTNSHYAGDDANDETFNGDVDNLTHFGRALTAAEAAYLHSGTPALALARTNDQITVSWCTPGGGWLLESTNALPSVAVASWPQVPEPYQTNVGIISVTLTNNSATGSQFFRLHKP